MIKYIIPLHPITKKNHQRIVINKRTGKPMIIQSKKYIEYAESCKWFLKPLPKKPIDYPVNVKCLYYVGRRNRADKTNFENAIMDILVSAGVLDDDNRNIAYSTDGSRVLYDKKNPRTEIYITEAGDFISWDE